MKWLGPSRQEWSRPIVHGAPDQAWWSRLACDAATISQPVSRAAVAVRSSSLAATWRAKSAMGSDNRVPEFRRGQQREVVDEHHPSPGQRPRTAAPTSLRDVATSLRAHSRAAAGSSRTRRAGPITGTRRRIAGSVAAKSNGT